MLINIDNSLKFTTSEFENQPKLYLFLGQSKKPGYRTKIIEMKRAKTSGEIEKTRKLARFFELLERFESDI
jgi:hypothetical protein